MGVFGVEFSGFLEDLLDDEVSFDCVGACYRGLEGGELVLN